MGKGIIIGGEIWGIIMEGGFIVVVNGHYNTLKLLQIIGRTL